MATALDIPPPPDGFEIDAQIPPPPDGFELDGDIPSPPEGFVLDSPTETTPSGHPDRLNELGLSAPEAHVSEEERAAHFEAMRQGREAMFGPGSIVGANLGMVRDQREKEAVEREKQIAEANEARKWLRSADSGGAEAIPSGGLVTDQGREVKGFEELGPFETIKGVGRAQYERHQKTKDLTFAETTMAPTYEIVPRMTTEEMGDTMGLSPSNPVARAATISQNVGSDIGNFFTSPMGIATLGIGAAPKGIQSLVAALFAGHATSAAPETISAVMEAKTPEERDQAITHAIEQIMILAGTGAHLAGRKPMSRAERTEFINDRALAAEQQRILAEPELTNAGARPGAAPTIPEPTPTTAAPAPLSETTLAEPAGAGTRASPAGEAPSARIEEGSTRPAEPTGGPQRRSGEAPIPSPEVGTPEASVKPTAPKVEVNDWTEATLPEITERASTAPKEAPSTTLGATPPGFAHLSTAMDVTKAAVGKVVSAIRDMPKFHDFRRSVLNWSARNQKSTGEIFKAEKEIRTSVPDPVRREAITNWIQAGGDTAILADRASRTTDLKRKKGYEAAQTLTPEEVAVAGKIRQTYDILLQRARDNGIEISELPNYVNQVWKRQLLKEFAASSNRKLSTSVRFAKQRFHDSFFDGEQAGLKPQTKDIAKLLPTYMNEINNAIASKQLVAELSKGKGSDGRPLVAPVGGVKTIDTAEGGKSHLVFPDMRNVETRDYVNIDQPALHGWRWKGQDVEGNPIMVKSDLLVHPEAASHFKNILGQSAIREWYNSPSESALGALPKAATKLLLDDIQPIAKATMLGFLSPFHQVQEGTHGIGHKVNPFYNIPKIDLTNPKQIDAARHGLMLLPDRVSVNQFREGLDGSSRNLASNLIGLAGKPGRKIKEWADGYQHYLFHEYIPGLKLKTYEHILERNTKRYVDELARGEVTMDQIKYLSAEQSNAAYGHLNYADIGRNPTIQHLAQVFLLAPDFLEARTRFTGQAARGATSKVGQEQLAAILTLAVTQYVAARILNQSLDGDPHWDHPFDVIVDNRRYTMRSVPEDIYKATKDSRRFISGRLSPIVGRGLLESLSGVNYRSEPTTVAETFTNILAHSVPLTLQPATRGLSETGKDNPVSPFEQLLGSLGLHVSRFSPVSEIYHLSKEWVEEHGKEYGLDKRRAVFPVSKFQQLRYALEDSNQEKAKEEMKALMDEEKISAGELETRFKQSINHHFTGSAKTDAAFKASLDDRGKQIYDAAIKRRELLIQRFKMFR